MKRWGDLTSSEKSKWLTIALVGIFIFFAILGTMAILQKPQGYVPEKDTRPVFGQDR